MKADTPGIIRKNGGEVMKISFISLLSGLMLLCLAACSAGGASSANKPQSGGSITEESAPQSSAETEYVIIKTYPEPYKYKKIDDKGIMAEIRRIVDSAEKEPLEEPSGGWSIALEFSDGTQVSVAGDILRINGTEYRTKASLQEKLRKIYDESPAEEINPREIN